MNDDASNRILKSLADAQKTPNAVVVMEGDYGGQIYLICPVAVLECNHETLKLLLEDLGALAWGDGEKIYYEALPLGASVSGGMGGGLVLDHVWLHQDFQEMKLRPEVEQIIAGLKPRLSSEAMKQAEQLSQAYSWAEREDEIFDLDWNRICKSGWTCTHCKVEGVAGQDFRLYCRPHSQRCCKFVLCNHCHLPQKLSISPYTPCPSCGCPLASINVRKCDHCSAKW